MLDNTVLLKPGLVRSEASERELETAEVAAAALEVKLRGGGGAVTEPVAELGARWTAELRWTFGVKSAVKNLANRLLYLANEAKLGVRGSAG